MELDRVRGLYTSLIKYAQTMPQEAQTNVAALRRRRPNEQTAPWAEHMFEGMKRRSFFDFSNVDPKSLHNSITPQSGTNTKTAADETKERSLANKAAPYVIAPAAGGIIGDRFGVRKHYQDVGLAKGLNRLVRAEEEAYAASAAAREQATHGIVRDASHLSQLQQQEAKQHARAERLYTLRDKLRQRHVSNGPITYVSPMGYQTPTRYEPLWSKAERRLMGAAAGAGAGLLIAPAIDLIRRRLNKRD